MNQNNEQIKNQDDLRKTVRNKGNASKAKKINKKLIFSIILVIAIIIGIIMIVKVIQDNKKIEQENIKEFNYFITTVNEKSGIIDKTGKLIIEPQYDYIQIPNPEKPMFICLYDYNTDTREYNSKVLNDQGKEILSKYNKIQAIPSNNTSINYFYQTNILKYKDNDKYGLITLDGKQITKPIYDSIETLEYKDGILKVKQDGKYGLIDINGEEIVKCEYNSITTDGYYDQDTKYEKAGFIVNIRTNEGYRYGYIDYKGKQTLDTIYTNLKRITGIKEGETVYIVTYKNGKAGMLKNSQTIFKNEYEEIEFDSTNKILALQKNAKQGVYDLSGNMILPIQYDDIVFSGTYINANKDGKLLVFDLSGTIQNDSSYKSIVPVKNGEYNITINRENLYGVTNREKTTLLDNKYSYIEYAFDNYFIVSQNGKSGVISTDTEKYIPIENNVVQNIKGTKIIQTINSDNVSEIYNKKMEKITTRKDARIYIKENYIEITSENNIEYFDFDGNKKEAKEIYPNNAIFAKEQNGKWGYVDKDGNTVVEFKYDITTDINQYGFGAIKINGKWGVIDKNGNIVKEPVYQLNDYKPNFIGEYYETNSAYQSSYYSNEIK